MKILKTNVMRGPNFWSNYRKNLIILKLDLEEYKDTLTNEIANFPENLKTLIPSLYNHRCSLGVAGGFFERLAKGTLLGHVVEHVALELQTLAGMDCGYGRARETSKKGIFNIVYSYQIERAGIRAGEIALDIVQTLVKNKPYLGLADDIHELKDIYADERLGPSTEAIINEALNRNIPVTPLNEKVIMLGYGSNQRIISSTMDDHTSCIGVDIVADKNMTKEILSSQYIPVPRGYIVRYLDELNEKLDILGFPVVIKPRFGNHGRGITTNITSREKAILAFELAKKTSQSVVLEKFICGFDYRFLVINYKLAAVAKRVPARIIGDGKSTVRALIDEVNKDQHRGEHHENLLTTIKVDETTLGILEEKGLTLDSILPNEEILYLKYTANISTGGTAIDVTDYVHSYNVFLAERIARLVNLDVCGIDIVAKSIETPLDENNGAILEVNAAPGFRMHLFPTSGMRRNVAKQFIDMLYPRSKPARIPIVAVTGTNGKTTVVRLIAHIAKQTHYTVGMATTEGLYIGNNLIHAGDCSGPRSATDILRDSSVDFAVLECARGGIIRSGLGFDKCSTSIVTNISEDHLGLEGIQTIEELAKVKSVVPHSTLENGYAILNADDPLVYDMKNELSCRYALFGLDRIDLIKEHCEQGHLACFVEDDYIYISDNKELIKVAKMSDIPITFKGKLPCMKYNILPAILSCWVNDFDLHLIVKGLMSFHPTAENLPGRYNLFHVKGSQIMLDYAHNEMAYKFLKDYLTQLRASKKIGIIAGTGDRRSIDIWKTGYYAGQIFDEIIIRHDKDPRGRTNEEITNLLLKGVLKANPNVKVKVISDEFKAVDYAIANAAPKSFIWYFPDHILAAVEHLKKLTSTTKNYEIENAS